MPVPKIDLRWCEALLAVHHHGTVSQAATILGEEQGTISGWLRKLGEELGIQTIYSKGNETFLTTNGEMVIKRIEALVSAANELTEHANPNSAHLGFTRSYTGLMGEFLNQLHSQPDFQQGMRFQLTCDISEELVKAVRNGDIDAAIVLKEIFRRVTKRKSTSVKEVGSFSQPSMIYLSAQHPMASGKSHDDHDLSNDEFDSLLASTTQEWIWFDPQSLEELHAKISEHFPAKQKGFNVTHIVRDQESLYALLLANRGVAILPSGVRGYNFPGVRVFSTPIELPRWEFCVIRHEVNNHPRLQSLYKALVKIGKALR